MEALVEEMLRGIGLDLTEGSATCEAAAAAGQVATAVFT